MKLKFLRKLFSAALVVALVVFVVAVMSILPSSRPTSSVQAGIPPAFPGAEGFGAVSVGGRGGRVIEVTTLADAVPAPAGSLRACATASGPRICVFRVGGTIELESISGTRFEITNPYLTIAGQTAPGGGILVKGFSGISIRTHDVIIRYLRVRLLGVGATAGGQVYISIGTGGYNVIVDHCSGSWTLDEGIQVWKHELPPTPDITNITVQRCLMAEGLAGHGMGMLIGGYDSGAVGGHHLKVHEISAHHNLFVHNHDRNPRVSSAGTQVINNVVYNWGSRVGVSARDNTVDFINNYWKPGPMSGTLIYKHESTNVSTGWVYPDPSIYISGNIVKGTFENSSADNWPLIVSDPEVVNAYNVPLPLSYRRYTSLAQSSNSITIQSAADAYTSVLADAGANARLDCQGNWVSNSDSVDQRVIADVNNGTGPSASPPAPVPAGNFPTIAAGTACTDSDHDGMADEWETIQFGNLSRGSSTDSSGDFDADGYTDLEEYLNGTNPKPADFIIQTPTYSPASPVAGNSMTFSGQVYNQTGSASLVNSSTRLRIDIDNNNTWDVLPSDMSTASLGIGGSELETWSNVWTATAGTHKFEICADATSVVAESNETNNCVSQTFTVTNPDTTPPSRSNGAPTGSLTSGTISTSISLATDENATCKYATSAGVAYASMTNTFSSTGATSHSTLVGGLSSGQTFSYFVRCQDGAGNPNTADFLIEFSVASPPSTTPPPDTTPPSRSNGAPTGSLTSGTISTSISLATDENATCKYATSAGVAYASMTNTFSSTGATSHSTLVSGLTNGATFSYYVRCTDGVGNKNTSDLLIEFSILGSATTGGPVPPPIGPTPTPTPTPAPGIPTPAPTAPPGTPTPAPGIPGTPTPAPTAPGTTPPAPPTTVILNEGSLIRGPDGIKVYIINAFGYKRHIFNPAVFGMYKHFAWEGIMSVSKEVLDSYTTSDLYRADGDPKVYSLEEVNEAGGSAMKHHLDMTAAQFTARAWNWNQVFIVNNAERDYYSTGYLIHSDTVIPY